MSTYTLLFLLGNFIDLFLCIMRAIKFVFLERIFIIIQAFFIKKYQKSHHEYLFKSFFRVLIIIIKFLFWQLYFWLGDYIFKKRTKLKVIFIQNWITFLSIISKEKKLFAKNFLKIFFSPEKNFIEKFFH